MTQKELAELLDVSPSSLNKVERERLHFGDYPSAKFIHKLAEEIDADEDELLLLADNVPNALRQAEYNQHQPDVIVGSSRGCAVAVNMQSGDTPLVLLCLAWKNWGKATTVKPNTVILHSRADDVIPFTDSEELVANSGLPAETLIEVGDDHRLADPEPLQAMLKACENFGAEAP